MSAAQQAKAPWLLALESIDPELAQNVASAHSARAERIAADPAFAERTPRTPVQPEAYRPPPRKGPPTLKEAVEWDEHLAFFADVEADVASEAYIKHLWQVEYAHRYYGETTDLDYPALAAFALSAYEIREIYNKMLKRQLMRRGSRRGSLQAVGRAASSLCYTGAPASIKLEPAYAINLAKLSVAARRKRARQAQALLDYRATGEVPSAMECRRLLEARHIDPDEDVD